ncbi:MAG: glycosyltransferase family 87 protein [Blastocatellia bacterium]
MKFTFTRRIKFALVVVASITGFTGAQLAFSSLSPTAVYSKDFIQEYLLAKAVLLGIDPYLPLPEVAKQVFGTVPAPVFPHPTPHTPALAVLSTPLGLVRYEYAAVLWLLLSIGCLIESVILLLRYWGGRIKSWHVVLICWAALGWSPVWEDLVIGQTNLPLLLLLIVMWQALRKGEEILGGVILGCVIALKLMAWPILIFLCLRRRWKSVFATFASAILLNLIALGAIGANGMRNYYFEVGPLLSSLYRAHSDNFSAWTIGWRLFSGTGSNVAHGISAPPFIESPTLALIFGYVLPAVLLITGLALAQRAGSFDLSIALLIAVGILVNPIAWGHYLVLVAIPAVIVTRRLVDLNFPGKETLLMAVIVFLLSLPGRFVTSLSSHFSKGEMPLETTLVPFGASLITLLPAACILCLIWVTWWVSRKDYKLVLN